MNFTLIDVGGFLLAVAAGFVVVVLPGLALSGVCGFRLDEDGQTARFDPRRIDPHRTDPLAGAVAGIALLPALTSLAVRGAGLDVALAAVLGLGVTGGVAAYRRGLVSPGPLAAALLAVWLIVLGLETIDVDVAGRLFQPITIFDGVKHAATTQAIREAGAPPRDAFFLRAEPAAYYYFYYTLAALILRLCGGLVDARAAFAGLTFWAGVAAFGAVRLTLTRLGGSRRPGSLLVILVMGASGLDGLAALLIWLAQHYWPADPYQWNEQVGVWLEDLLWVPHHVAGLIAGLVACVALCDVADRPHDRRSWRPIVTAGIALASCFGLSVWVCFGFVATLILWGAGLAIERRWRAGASMALAAVLAFVLVVPQLLDLKAGRVAGEVPVELAIRDASPVTWFVAHGALNLALRLLLLPVNYMMEFGVLCIGAACAWQLSTSRGTFGRLLLFMAVSGLLLGSFLRSTQLGNDLGWRVMLLPLLAGTAWTILALDRALAARSVLLVPAAVLILLGWTTTLYALVAARAYPFMTSSPFANFVAARTDTARDLRMAYTWAARQMPAGAVLQQNPTAMRALAFGLYGRQRTAVGDRFASLYGADPAAVAARIKALDPIFNTRLDADEVRAIATRQQVDALVVTANDAVWSQPSSFVWRVRPIYTSSRVRIVPVTAIGHPR